MDKLTGRVRAAVEKYQLIEEGDRIAVGVSSLSNTYFPPAFRSSGWK